MERVEALLPLVNDDTPDYDRNAVELSMVSGIVIEYEKRHHPIAKPTVAELIALSLEERDMTQKQLANEIGVRQAVRIVLEPKAVRLSPTHPRLSRQ